MNKQEIIDEINKTKKHLINMEKMLKELEYERWKPELNEGYYYVNQVNATFRAVNDEFDIDVARYRTYNCFKTEEEAKQEAEKILVRRQLEDIVKRLNKGKKFEWDNFTQWKRYLYFDFEINCIMQGYSTLRKQQGVIYSLSRDFKDVAIQEIGEGRLKKYLKDE